MELGWLFRIEVVVGYLGQNQTDLGTLSFDMYFPWYMHKILIIM